MYVLEHATEKLSLDWLDEPRESQSSKLNERFLDGSGSRPARRKLPLFPDLHHEIYRSWKQHFSSCLTNAAAADFTNLVGSVEQGYATVPARSRTRSLRSSRLLTPPHGSPTLSFHPSHVEPPLLCSISPTCQRDRQVRLSTLWPSFRSTKQRY